MRTETIKQIVAYAKLRLQSAGFDKVVVSADAPVTFEGVNHMFTYAKQYGFLYVHPDGIDDSIYGERADHAVVRAFHDFLHWQLQKDFSFTGEAAVAEQFIRELSIWTNISQIELAEVWADTVGQLVYYQISGGGFVKDQRKFNRAFADLMITSNAF